jgi:integrase
VPRIASDTLTVANLCNHFLTAKAHQRDASEIRPKTFVEYHSTCNTVVTEFGKNRPVDDLRVTDFEKLRATLAKRLGVHGLSREVQQVRSLFKYGVDAGLIEKVVLFGPTFKRPSKRHLRAHRQKSGPRMFEATQVRLLLDQAEQPLRAMILLGINCGFGNTDCGTLTTTALDLKKGWIDFPRPKTAIERRCPLWPETIAALREAREQRPHAKSGEHDDLVFITKYGQPWAKDTPDSPVTKEFRKLLDAVDATAARTAKKRRAQPPQKIHRKGMGFYALRHTFATIASGSLDQVAVDHIMGHSDNSMAERYRERIDDERLRKVANFVRRWLLPGKRPK